MAAKSLKFTASARWPMDRASLLVREMAAGDDGIHRRRQFRIRGHPQQRGIIADAQQHVGSAARTRAPKNRLINSNSPRCDCSRPTLRLSAAGRIRVDAVPARRDPIPRSRTCARRWRRIAWRVEPLPRARPDKATRGRSAIRAARSTGPRARSDRVRRAGFRTAPRAGHRARRDCGAIAPISPGNTRGRPAELPGRRYIAFAFLPGPRVDLQLVQRLQRESAREAASAMARGGAQGIH